MYFQNQRKILRSIRSGKFPDWRANTMPLSLSFLSGRASMERHKIAILSGTAPRIMLRVMSKRQKMTIIGNCVDDDLSGSNNYFFWPLTRFPGPSGRWSERLRTIAPSRLVSVRAQYVGVGIVSINAVAVRTRV